MTDEEKHRTYVPQVTNPRGNQTLKTRDWIPATIREEVTAFGYAPVTQKIKIALNNGSHQEAMAKVFIYGLAIDTGDGHGADINDANDGIIVKLSQAGTSEFIGAAYKPLVVFQQSGADFDAEWIEISDDHLDAFNRRAQVVRFGDNNDNRYILRAGPGRYAAVHVLDMDAAVIVADCGAPGQITDACGNCVDPIDACIVDCSGTPGGTDIEDECGNCGAYDYGVTRDASCLMDCSDVYGGGATEDECGVCDTMPGNDNTTCEQDCNGNWDGDDIIDVNRTGSPCVDPTLLYVQDCDGNWVDPLTPNLGQFDSCGVCKGSNNTCTPDCDTQWPYIAGSAETGPLGNIVATHARRNPLYDSSKTYDDCDECLSPMVTLGCAVQEAAYRACTVGCDSVNDAYQECLNTEPKSKNLNWNQTCDRDCAGKWDGGALVDSCGVCIDTDNPDDTRVPNSTCSADCDTEIAYLDDPSDGADAYGTAGFDAWIWTRDGANPNYGYGAMNANAAFDATKELDDCGICDNDPVTDCVQEEDGLMWQAGNASSTDALAATVVTGSTIVAGNLYTLDPEEAATYCADLVLGGVSTWRLPTNAELTALIGSPLQYFTDAAYWTSDSAFANTHRSVDFGTSESKHSFDTEALRVRCVQ